jgi:hypothetical protein
LLVVSGILFVTTLLPWWGSYEVYPGFSVGGYMGIHGGGYLTFLMSLVGIATAFLESQKTRALIGMGAGILALLGVIIAFATLSGWGIGFGLIIALIASVGLGVVSFLEYRKWMGSGASGASGAYTPPTQTPPAQTPPSAGPSGTPSPPQPPPPPPPPPK